MKFTLSQRFTFDAAHTLDRSESSRRVHGHTYFAEVAINGEPHPVTGMITDLSELRRAIASLRDELDHRMLDDVAQLGPATLENLAAFIFRRLRNATSIRSARVWRSDGGSCLVESAA